MPQSRIEQSGRCLCASSEWASIREDHFRWLLMWHGDFVRRLTLFEVERDGLRLAKARSKVLDERRQAYVASIDPKNRKKSAEPR